jgi:lysophospholipase L1-like esterase
MKRDWDIVTSYIDYVGTSDKTVLFPKPQDSVKVTNKGNTNLIYTIGTKSGTLAPNGSVTVNEILTNFSLRAEADRAEYEVRASEAGTDQEESTPTLPSDVVGTIEELQSSLAQKAAKTDLDLKRDKSALIGMTDLGQDVKTGMTGGSVAVVGVNGVIADNVVDKQISPRKTNFFTKQINLYNSVGALSGYTLTTTVDITANASYNISGYIPVEPDTTYTNVIFYADGSIGKAAARIVYYDSTQAFLSGVATVSTTEITTPANARFMRMSNLIGTVDYVNGTNILFCKSTDYKSFLIMPDDVQINDLHLATIGKKKVYTVSKNLYNVAEYSQLQILNLTNLQFGKSYADLSPYKVAHATYSITGFVPVDSRKTYYLYSYAGASLATVGTYRLYYFDSKKRLVGYSSTSVTSFTPPSENIKYAIIAFSNSFKSTLMIFDYTSTEAVYIPFQEKLCYEDGTDVFTGNETWYKNKMIAMLGDSITNQGKFVTVLKNKLEIGTFQNCGVSGTTVAQMGADDRIAAMDVNADVVMFMGGTNDYAQNVPLGTIADSTTATFYGRLNILAQKLLTKYPAKLMMWCTTPYGMQIDGGGNAYLANTLGLTTKDYGNCIKEVAGLYGIPVCDIYGNSGWNKYNIGNWVANDGAYFHPNTNGGYKLGEIMVGALKRIEPSGLY